MSNERLDFDLFLQGPSPEHPQVIEIAIRSTYYLIFDLTYAMLLNLEEARKTTREVYENAWKNLDRYSTGSNFKVWLSSIAVTTCRRKLNNISFGGKRIDWHVSDENKNAEFNKAVFELPSDLRLPSILFFSHHFSIADISQILGWSEKITHHRLLGASNVLNKRFDSIPLITDPEKAKAYLAKGPTQWTTIPQADFSRPDHINQLIREVTGTINRKKQRRLPEKFVKEVAWVMIAICLVFSVGWFLNKQAPPTDTQNTIYPTPTGLPTPLEESRTFLSSETDRGLNQDSNTLTLEGSWEPKISGNGRWIIFSSSVRNLVEDDSNDRIDVFVYDNKKGSIQRVSVSSGGRQADGHSYQPDLSSDGRFIVFTSGAGNLVSDDTQTCGEKGSAYNCSDVFLYDTNTKATQRLSVSSEGEAANNTSLLPSISADGRWIAYWSRASNLVEGDEDMCGQKDNPHNCLDIFIHDRLNGSTERIMIGRATGEMANPFSTISISSDGGRVVTSIHRSDLVAEDLSIPNLWDLYLYNRVTQLWEPLNMGQDHSSGDAPSLAASISGDGHFIAFTSAATNLVPNDHNGKIDVFVRALETGKVERVSISSSGGESDGDSGTIIASGRGDWFIDTLHLSHNGRWVLFISNANNLSEDSQFNCSFIPSLPGESYRFCYNLLLHDRQTGETELVYGPNQSFTPYASISANGQWVTYMGNSFDCISRGFCSDIFLFDRLQMTTLALNVASSDLRRGDLSTFDSSTWSHTEVLRGHRGWVNGLAFSRDSRWLASVSIDRSLRLWSIPDAENLLVIDEIDSNINHVNLSPDGKTLVAGASNGKVYLWRAPGGRLQGVIEGSSGAVTSTDYSPDGKTLAIASLRSVSFLNAATGEYLHHSLDYLYGSVASVAYAPAGDLIAVANTDHTVWIYRVVDGALVLRLGSHTRPVTAVAFSPNGRYLASGSADQTVNIWQLDLLTEGEFAAKLIMTFAHDDWVSSLAFAPNSSTLVSGSYDGAVRLWSFPGGSGENILLLRRPQDQIRSVGFSPDGRYLAAGTSGGEIHLWRSK